MKNKVTYPSPLPLVKRQHCISLLCMHPNELAPGCRHTNQIIRDQVLTGYQCSNQYSEPAQANQPSPSLPYPPGNGNQRIVPILRPIGHGVESDQRLGLVAGAKGRGRVVDLFPFYIRTTTEIPWH